MIKKYILFMCLILFLTISVVNASENMSDLEISNKTSNFDLYSIDEFHNNLTSNISNNVTLNSQTNQVYKLVSNNISSVYGKKVKFSVKVLNKQKSPLKNKLVVFKIIFRAEGIKFGNAELRTDCPDVA